MLVSIQNDFGGVYGGYPVPETVPPTPLGVDGFAGRVAYMLQDEPVVDRIFSDTITYNDTEHDRVVIKVDVFKVGEDGLSSIQQAIGFVSVEHLLPLIAP